MGSRSERQKIHLENPDVKLMVTLMTLFRLRWVEGVLRLLQVHLRGTGQRLQAQLCKTAEGGATAPFPGQVLGEVLQRGEKAVHLVRSVLASRPLSWSSWVLRSNLPLSLCRTL